MHAWEGKARAISKELLIFVLNFTTVQLILLICQQELAIATLTSIAMSLATSLVRRFVRGSWKNILTKPRLCQNPECGRDLSSHPMSIAFCPYCSKKLDSEES